MVKKPGRPKSMIADMVGLLIIIAIIGLTVWALIS